MAASDPKGFIRSVNYPPALCVRELRGAGEVTPVPRAIRYAM